MKLFSGHRRLSIRAAVWAGLGVVLLFTAVLAVGTYRALARAGSTHHQIVATTQQTVLLEEVRAEYLTEWMALVSARALADERMVERFNQARDRVDAALAGLAQGANEMGPGEELRVRMLTAEHQRLTDTWAPVVALLLDGRRDEAQALMSSDLFLETSGFVNDVAGELQLHQDTLGSLLLSTGETRTGWTRSMLLLAALWLSLLALILFAAERGLLKPLDELARVSRAIAAGETVATAPVGGPSEVSSLARDVNLMASSLLARSRELNDYLSKDLEARSAELERANEALRETDARLNAVIDKAPLILFALDREGILTLVKGRALALLRTLPARPERLSIFDQLGPDSPIEDSLRRALAGEPVAVEIELQGNVFETHLTPLRDEASNLTGVIGVAIDITERHRVADALRASEERYRELIENANDIIYTHDLEGRFTSMNQAGLLLSGYSREEVMRMSIRDFITPETLEATLEMFRKKLQGIAETTTYQVEVSARNGTRIPLEVSSRVVYEGGKPVAIQGIARDISDRHRAELALKQHTRDLESLFEQLKSAHAELAWSERALEEKSRQLEQSLEIERARSRLDPLTGALNHGGIIDEMRSLVAGAAPAAVIMLDIDAMKAANDMYGHPFGDRVLLAAKEVLSRDGAIVGRYGGDEFLAILPGAGQVEAESYRRAVLAALGESGLKDPQAGNDVHIVASIGYALFPRDGRRIDDLIAAADNAMYAHRRHQPAPASTTRRMGGDRVVRLVGEVVPVLTAPGDQREQLSFVCERLAVDCGYDGVELMINPYRSEGRETVVSYPPIPPDLESAWRRAREDYYSGSHPLPLLLEKVRRPVIIDKAQEDGRLVEFQRQVLKIAGLKSVMIAPLNWERELIGSITVASRQESAFGPADAQLLMGIASQVSSIVSMASLLREFRLEASRLGNAHRAGVRLLASIVERQSGALSHDMDRLAGVASALAIRLGFSEREAEQVGIATMLHDVGKYGIPANIIASPIDLTPDEFEVIKGHSLLGARLLADLPGFELAAQVARWHHERWDGHGYPDGLAGDEIPLAVAIASVSDAIDAMIYDRVYRDGIGADAALDEVVAASGSHFNPAVVRALIQLRDEGALPLNLTSPDSGRLAA